MKKNGSEKVSTKEKILQASLELFAKKGYDGVSVREIARAVGVRESALYKHFANKEDILQKVIEDVKERITKAYVSNKIPEVVEQDIAKGYRNLMEEELCDMSWNLFQLYTKEPMVSDFRRLLMREQFNNNEIAKLYNQFFLDGVIKKQGLTFAALVKDHFFKEEDPEIIALHFYGPILLLFQRYDCEPAKEDDIKEMLFQHVKTFGANYTYVKKEEVQ